MKLLGVGGGIGWWVGVEAALFLILIQVIEADIKSTLFSLNLRCPCQLVTLVRGHLFGIFWSNFFQKVLGLFALQTSTLALLPYVYKTSVSPWQNLVKS